MEPSRGYSSLGCVRGLRPFGTPTAGGPAWDRSDCASCGAQAFRTLWVDTSGLTQWMLSEEEMLAMTDAINLFK